MEGKLYRISAVLFYLAALGFYTAALISGNMHYTATGAGFMCIGALFMVLSKHIKKQEQDIQTNWQK